MYQDKEITVEILLYLKRSAYHLQTKLFENKTLWGLVGLSPRRMPSSLDFVLLSTYLFITSHGALRIILRAKKVFLLAYSSVATTLFAIVLLGGLFFEIRRHLISKAQKRYRVDLFKSHCST